MTCGHTHVKRVMSIPSDGTTTLVHSWVCSECEERFITASEGHGAWLRDLAASGGMVILREDYERLVASIPATGPRLVPK